MLLVGHLIHSEEVDCVASCTIQYQRLPIDTSAHQCPNMLGIMKPMPGSLDYGQGWALLKQTFCAFFQARRPLHAVLGGPSAQTLNQVKKCPNTNRCIQIMLATGIKAITYGLEIDIGS